MRAEPLGVEYVEEEWEHGLRCADCERLMREGERYSERLESLTGDGVPVVLIVCVGCALTPKDSSGGGR